MPEQFILPAGDALAPLEAETLAGTQARDYRKARVGVQARFLIGDNDEIDVRIILAYNGQLGVGVSRVADGVTLDGPTLFGVALRSGRQANALDPEGQGWRGSVPRALLPGLEIIVQRVVGSELFESPGGPVTTGDGSAATSDGKAPGSAHAPPGDA